jgi:hypothetical protein
LPALVGSGEALREACVVGREDHLHRLQMRGDSLAEEFRPRPGFRSSDRHRP